jgi:hypothetical protein
MFVQILYILQSSEWSLWMNLTADFIYFRVQNDLYEWIWLLTDESICRQYVQKQQIYWLPSAYTSDFSFAHKTRRSPCWWPNLASLKKLDHPVSYSGLSDFGSFQNRNETWATLEDLKIQDVLRHRKRLKSIKEPRWKKYKPEVEVAKIGLSGFGYRSIRFSQNR